MAFGRGPNIVTDGLVFGYDADDRSTRFYKGEPTTNVVLNSRPTSGWSILNSGGSAVTASYGVEDSIPYMKLSGVVNNIDVPRIYDSTFTSTVTGDVTLSFEAKGTPGAGLKFRIYENGSTKITQMVYITSEWTRYTYTTNTAFILDQPYFNPDTTGAEYYIRNIQVEQKNHATQFTEGTRTVTNSLIDLKRSTSIDLSNVSFDSTAHPVFDGVDDRITFPTPHGNDNTSLTYEVIYKGIMTDASGYSYILHNSTTESTGNSFCTFGYVESAQNQIYGAFNGQFGTMVTTVPSTSDKYLHLVLTWDGYYQRFYVDGVLKTTQPLTSFTYLTGDVVSVGGHKNATFRMVNGTIPVVKIYKNKALSLQEIQQNFNSYKYRFNI